MNLILPGPPGDIITSTLHGQCLGRGTGIHLQDPFHGTTLIPLFIPRAHRLAGDPFGSTASLPETCCVLKPINPSLPVLPDGGWRKLAGDERSPLFAPSADTALLFLPSAYLQTHTKAKSREKQFISWGYLWVWNIDWSLKMQRSLLLCTHLSGRIQRLRWH